MKPKTNKKILLVCGVLTLLCGLIILLTSIFSEGSTYTYIMGCLFISIGSLYTAISSNKKQ